GAAKQAFLELRAEDMVMMYDHEFSKKKAEETGQKLVSDIFENGLVDPIHVMSNLVRLKAVVDSADKAFRARLNLSAANSWNGVTITPKSVAVWLKYYEDQVCKDLAEKLKARQELDKLATKSKDTIYDSEGCEVPKVSSKFDKDSITITF